MTAINSNTRAKIKGFLEGFIENLVIRYQQLAVPTMTTPEAYVSQVSTQPQFKLFHAAVIPPELMRISAFERGFSTSLGTSYEECAQLIALQHHREAHRGYDLQGMLSRTALNQIDQEVATFEHAAKANQKVPSLDEMIDAVLSAHKSDDLEPKRIRADLHIVSHSGIEYFFEIKSPQPNKGQCLEVTQRILRFHLLREQVRPQVQGLFAMAYNPYGTEREHYRWSIAKTYMPFEQAVVIGSEFWDIIGGPTTYAELLEIYQEVGQLKSKYMLDALAFGFKS